MPLFGAQTPTDKTTGPSGLQRFAKNLGRAGISLATGVPAIELDRQVTQNRRLETQALAEEQDVEAGRIQAEKDQRLQALRSIIAGGGPDADAAIRETYAIDPEMGEAAWKQAGLETQAQREEAAKDARDALSLPPEQQIPFLLERGNRLDSENRESTHTRQAAAITDPKRRELELRMIANAPLTTAQTRVGQTGTPAEQKAFESLIADFSPDDQKMARRIKAGLDARAGSSSIERLGDDPEATRRVAQSQAQIEGAKTGAEIQAELTRSDDTAAAAANEARLVEAALQGERIKANQVKTVNEARRLLPDAQAGAAEMVGLLNEIRNDPLLPNILGAVEGRVDVRLDEGEAELLAKIKQVTGKTFLQAYQSLKGGGPITDREGQAATEAQSRLSTRTVGVEAYQGAIDELIGITDSRLSRLSRKAELTEQVPQAPAQQQVPATGGAAPEGTVITNDQGQSFIKQGGQWVPNG